MKVKKLLLVSAIGLSIAGCESESDGGMGASTLSSSDYVSGEFFNKLDTNVKLDSGNSRMSSACGDDNGSDRYFVTDNAIVFANETLPDSDFKHAATLVQNQFSVALSKMDMTEAEYVSYKTPLSSNDTSTLYSELSLGDSTNGYSYQVYEDLIVSLGYSATAKDNTGGFDPMKKVFFNALAAFTEDELDAFLSEATAELIDVFKRDNPGYSEDQLTFYTDNINNKKVDYSLNKVAVCLDSGNDMSHWGEGTLEGMIIAANSIVSRSDDSRIVLHELIHHLQATITVGSNVEVALERWFAEGQAVYLSGQSITNDASHNRNPIKVISNDDETIQYSSTSQAYSDYGQAYRYVLNSYGSDAINDMIFGVRNNIEVESFNNFNGTTYPAFEAEFTKHLTDIDQLRLDYPSITTK